MKTQKLNLPPFLYFDNFISALPFKKCFYFSIILAKFDFVICNKSHYFKIIELLSLRI